MGATEHGVATAGMTEMDIRRTIRRQPLIIHGMGGPQKEDAFCPVVKKHIEWDRYNKPYQLNVR